MPIHVCPAVSIAPCSTHTRRPLLHVPRTPVVLYSMSRASPRCYLLMDVLFLQENNSSRDDVRIQINVSLYINTHDIRDPRLEAIQLSPWFIGIQRFIPDEPDELTWTDTCR
ncbi:hypothetical protein E4T43_03329 [Aureobasidium subglaciale]|nr:hypothetical protein E4T43_03329 [Aureobasidium subglaciale]